MMKKNILFKAMMMLLAVATLSLVSCGKDDDDDDGPDDNEAELAAFAELEGTWLQTGITQNGKEPQYEITTSPTLVIGGSIGAYTYAVTDGHYVLPTGSGSWTFVASTNFLRLNLGDFDLVRGSSGTTLTLTRTVDTEIGPGVSAGRVETIGTYVMTFEKQP